MSQVEDLAAAAGRCFMVGFHGDAPDARLAGLLEAGEVAGVILFTRNGGEAEEIAAVCARVRELDPAALISLDQEGGAVLRVVRGASDLPGAMALAASGDEALVEEVGHAAGRELLAMGADLNLAPVLDVNRVEANPGIGVRSFGITPEPVARYGAAYIRGIARAGALACGKHFPGKGAARVDAHLALPSVDDPLEVLRAQDLAPFGAVVQAGVPCLMSSHVVYPAVDPELPATFSAPVIDLARRDLAFGGVMVTDDLEMGALVEYGGDAEDRGVRSLAAGHDLLLVCHDRDLHLAMRDRVVAAVERGDLPEARVREAAARIDALRARARAASRPELADAVAAARPLVGRAHLAGITRHRGPLPVETARPTVAYLPILEGLTQAEEGTGSGELLEEGLRGIFSDLEIRRFRPRTGELEGGDPGPADRAALVFSYNAHLFPGQAERLKEVAAAAPWVGLVTLRNPFDLRILPDADLALSGQGFRRSVQRLLPEVLAGRLEPGGSFELPETPAGEPA